MTVSKKFLQSQDCPNQPQEDYFCYATTSRLLALQLTHNSLII